MTYDELLKELVSLEKEMRNLTEELRDDFLNNFRDIIETAKPLI